MGLEQVLIAPRAPWQNPYAERIIGSIRRECLDHVIVLNEDHLRRILAGYFDYYHNSGAPVAGAELAEPTKRRGARRPGRVESVSRWFASSLYTSSLRNRCWSLDSNRGSTARRHSGFAHFGVLPTATIRSIGSTSSLGLARTHPQ
jgi:hypothetical protein